jgi:hypothetical protein
VSTPRALFVARMHARRAAEPTAEADVKKPVWLKDKPAKDIRPADLVALRDEAGRRSALIFAELVIRRPELMDYQNQKSWLFHVAQGAAILASTDPAQVEDQFRITHRRITGEMAERLPAVVELVGDIRGTMFARIVAEAEAYWSGELAEAEPAGWA